MKPILVTSVLALASQASAYGIVGSASLNCRTGPTLNDGIVKTYLVGDEIDVICQAMGKAIYGDPVWNLTQDGCYVSNYYLDTGSGGGGMVKEACASDAAASVIKTKTTSASPTSELGSIGNDSSTEASKPITMTKIRPPSSSGEGPSATSTLLTLSSKPNHARPLAANSRSVAAIVLAGMLGGLF
ncbi:hypothetical protein GGI12_002382 [Dipsacomyces acuminosporus]|nr:hypothetical protein GGI12_002382 [Dipsacomyces acuminosporus]